MYAQVPILVEEVPVNGCYLLVQILSLHHTKVVLSGHVAAFVVVVAQPIMSVEAQLGLIENGYAVVGQEAALEVLAVVRAEVSPLILLQGKMDLSMSCLTSFLCYDMMGILYHLVGVASKKKLVSFAVLMGVEVALGVYLGFELLQIIRSFPVLNLLSREL